MLFAFLKFLSRVAIMFGKIRKGNHIFGFSFHLNLKVFEKNDNTSHFFLFFLIFSKKL